VVLWALHTGGNEITGYLKDVSQPTLTITKGLSDASDIAIDSNSPGTIAVFPPGKMTASRQITSGISGPVAMVFDAKGNLYVGNYPNKGSNTVTVYAPGASKPTTTYKRKQQIVGLAISQ
jgi:hypothetical protein